MVADVAVVGFGEALRDVQTEAAAVRAGGGGASESVDEAVDDSAWTPGRCRCSPRPGRHPMAAPTDGDHLVGRHHIFDVHVRALINELNFGSTLDEASEKYEHA